MHGTVVDGLIKYCQAQGYQLHLPSWAYINLVSLAGLEAVTLQLVFAGHYGLFVNPITILILLSL